MIYHSTCPIKTRGWKRWQATLDALNDAVATAENLKPCIAEVVADCPCDVSDTLLTEANSLRRVVDFLEQQSQQMKEKANADF
ncbi:MAG: hypothetical protein Q8R61_13065 [Thiobacillus sp.]|uniref:hypothetical protein n=1 Tax=Thiobacillus sp. TaxID=924 RepID=UPI0027328090|nr:hypothetical protein [Thiobacillus sp.]MDP3586054.1 hypothetical protein [Thiobacillus sp.]